MVFHGMRRRNAIRDFLAGGGGGGGERGAVTTGFSGGGMSFGMNVSSRLTRELC